MEYGQEITKRKKQSLNDARQKGGRNWILPQEYDAFLEGIEEAILMEERRKNNAQLPGPFRNLLNYKPGTDNAGIFPPLGIWKLDMYRVLYGLGGEKGDLMRKAELSVYDGVPFSEGFTGRKKIADTHEKGKSKKDDETIVASYWLEKIKAEARQIFAGKWLPLRYIFTEKELQYSNEVRMRQVKTENQ